MRSTNQELKRQTQVIVLAASALLSQVAISGISGGDSAVRGISGGDSQLHGISGGDSQLHGISGGDSRLRGISGGDSRLRGISGGDSRLRGISGGDSRLRGISGGDSRLRGISGGDSRLRGISGGDSRLRGISGGDSRLRGISGGDSRLRGISGGDSQARGISGGDSRLRTEGTSEAQASGAAEGSAPLFASVAMGPVEDVSVDDTGASVLIVLGQRFVGDAGDVAALSIGDYVLAAGIEIGTLDVVIPMGETYVPGASEVRLMGPVTDSDPSTASLSVGDTVFNYTEQLVREPSFSPGVGDVIDVIGVQPVPSGSVLLGISGGDNRLHGISGGDSRVRGISGGDSRVRGISGGDSRVRGISGGDSRVRGISGGDRG